DGEEILAPGADARRRLTGVERDGRILLAEFAVFTWFVVVAEDIDRCLKPVVSGIGIVAARGQGSCRVLFADASCKLLRKRGPVRSALFADLVSGAPEDDTRMIAIAPYLCSKVLLVPVIKQ